MPHPANPPLGGAFPPLGPAGPRPLSNRRRIPRRRSVEQVAAQVQLYPRSQRLALLTLAREHPRLEDLLFSCPVVAAGFAEFRGPAAARGEALNLLRRGAALAEVMTALEMPLWLRKLPPEACGGAPSWPFPGDPGRAPLQAGGEYDLRADVEFGRRALSLLPSARRARQGFLRWLCCARAALGDEFTLWLLSGRLNWGGVSPETALAPLAAYVWFSRQDGLPASALLPRPWSPTLPVAAALRDARRWRLRLCFEARRRAGDSAVWAQERRIRGYLATPLRTLERLTAEGEAMRNCMASYAEPAAMGACRIFALRRGGKSVANLEIRLGRDGAPPPRIVQVLGPRNVKASAPSVAAARLLLEEIVEALEAAGEDPKQGFGPPDDDAWRALVAPFLESAVCAALPARTSIIAAGAMGAALIRLERLAAARLDLRL